MKAKNILLSAIAALLILVPLAMVFVHLNFSFHRRSWEKSRIEAQREAAHGYFERSEELYDFALQDADKFPITPLMHATTFAEAGDTQARLKKYAQAAQFYNRALSLARNQSEREWLAVQFASLSGLGRIQFEQADYPSAQATLSSALPIYAQLIQSSQRSTDDLIAGDIETHNLICLAGISDKAANAAKSKGYITRAEELLMKFPVDVRSKNELARLAEKYQVITPDVDQGG